MEQNIGIEFKAAGQVLGQRGGIEGCLFFGGEGIEFATDAVDTVQYVMGTTMTGAFEEGMLDKMGHALVGSRFVTAADVDIHSRVYHPRGGVGQDYSDSVAEGVVLVHC